MPKWVTPILVILFAVSLIPFAFIARARTTKSGQPRVHVVPNMDNQQRFESQQANAWYADGRAMRLPVEGTVARGRLDFDAHFTQGLDGEAYAETFPDRVEITHPLIERGAQRYAIYCAPCHGLSGYGDGVVARRADRLQQGTWVPPSSFHIEPASTRSVGHLYNTITNGIRTMPSYGSQI
ncbi:MAG: c-type cytochrome, partial [Planctomycetota bacterium]